MVETAREVGGAIGVAIVATVAVGHSNDVLASFGGSEEGIPTALTAGFERGLLVAAALAVAAACRRPALASGGTGHSLCPVAGE
jgi:hypothetical protein